MNKLIAKALMNDGAPQYKDKYRKVCKRPVLVTSKRKLGKIVSFGADNAQLWEYVRLVGKCKSNLWISVSNVKRANGRLIDKDLIINAPNLTYNDGNVRKQYTGTVVVTNVDNVENITFPTDWFKTRNYNKGQRNEQLEDIVSKLGIPIDYGTTNVPQITPLANSIAIPDFNQYNTSDEYYLTLFHEIAHYARFNWLNVDQLSTADPIAYNREEVIVELTAQKICDTAGLNYDKENSINYIGDYGSVITRRFDQRMLDNWIDYIEAESDRTVLEILKRYFEECKYE